MTIYEKTLLKRVRNEVISAMWLPWGSHEAVHLTHTDFWHIQPLSRFWSHVTTSWLKPWLLPPSTVATASLPTSLLPSIFPLVYSQHTGQGEPPKLYAAPHHSSDQNPPAASHLFRIRAQILTVASKLYLIQSLTLLTSFSNILSLPLFSSQQPLSSHTHSPTTGPLYPPFLFLKDSCHR